MANNNECVEVMGALKKLIEITSYYDHDSLEEVQEWLDKQLNNIGVKCYEVMECGNEASCPGVDKLGGRCWLVAGTMCTSLNKDQEPRGLFARKYRTCTKCPVFEKYVHRDQVTELREQLIILVYNLLSKQREMRDLLLRTVKAEIEDLKKNNGS